MKKIVPVVLWSFILLWTTTFAFRWNVWPKNVDEATRTAIQTAIEKWDYSMFQNAVKELPIASRITEERFQQIKERQKTRDERRQTREEIEKALESKDYAQWKLLVQKVNPERVELINSQEKFEKLVLIHEYHEKIVELKKELWLPEKWSWMNNWNRMWNKRWMNKWMRWNRGGMNMNR